MWSSYRRCTSIAGLCNLVLGVVLVALWSTCYRICLSRQNVKNDWAAPLWTGIIAFLAGLFGLVTTCLCWKRINETLYAIVTLLTVLCSTAAIALSINASLREYLLYQEQGRPLATLDDGILGVFLFAVMSVLSFVVFMVSITWSCICVFKRVRSKPEDEDGEDDEDNAEASAWGYQTSRSFHSLTRAVSFNEASPAPPHGGVSSPHTEQSPPSPHQDRRWSSTAEPGGRSSLFNAPRFSTWDTNRDAARKLSVPQGPRFGSVTAAELRWWDYYRPPKEHAGFSGF